MLESNNITQHNGGLRTKSQNQNKKTGIIIARAHNVPFFGDLRGEKRKRNERKPKEEEKPTASSNAMRN